MSEDIIKKEDALKKLNNEQIEIIKKTICKDATDEEFKYFLEVARATKLNPFLKEIWFYKQPKYITNEKGERIKTNEYEIVIFAGRDGFLKKANEHPAFDGMESKIIEDEKGNIKGAVARVYRKDRTIPTEVFVDFREYYKGNSVWKSKPRTMILKVAEAQALKKAFSITGLYSYEEFGGENIEDIKENEIVEQKTDIKTAEKIFKALPQEKIKDILATNNVATLRELPLNVSLQILKELENKNENHAEIIEKDRIEYEIRINWQKSMWEIVKLENGIEAAIYNIDRELKSCTCPSRKQPCKHIEMIKEIKNDSVKYAEILKKYPQPTPPKINNEIKKEVDLIKEKKGICEAILWYFDKKFGMKTISTLRFLNEKFGITTGEFTNKNKKVIGVYDKIFKIKESEVLKQ